MTIGIIWINHHAMISRLRTADHSILILNLVLLMSIGLLPFATKLRGLPPYALATALGLVSPYLTLGITAALALYYALPIASGGQAEVRVSSE